MATRPGTVFAVALATAALLLATALPVTGASRTFTLWAQLYGDPNERSLLGTLELRLSQAYGDPDQYQAMGKARFGGGADGYSALVITGGGTEIRWGDPNEFNGVVVFTLDILIPADLASRMVGDPDQFTATVYVGSTPVGSGPLMGAPVQ
jgi:hypothetical protein